MALKNHYIWFEMTSENTCAFSIGKQGFFLLNTHTYFQIAFWMEFTNEIAIVQIKRKLQGKPNYQQHFRFSLSCLGNARKTLLQNIWTKSNWDAARISKMHQTMSRAKNKLKLLRIYNKACGMLLSIIFVDQINTLNFLFNSTLPRNRWDAPFSRISFENINRIELDTRWYDYN